MLFSHFRSNLVTFRCSCFRCFRVFQLCLWSYMWSAEKFRPESLTHSDTLGGTIYLKVWKKVPLSRKTYKTFLRGNRSIFASLYQRKHLSRTSPQKIRRSLWGYGGFSWMLNCYRCPDFITALKEVVIHPFLFCRWYFRYWRCAWRNRNIPIKLILTKLPENNRTMLFLDCLL